MKIIVTGALGHIGSSLIRYLSRLKNINKIYLVDNFASQRYCSLFNLPDKAPFSFLELDLANCKIKDIPTSDFIIHLAAKTDAAQSPKYEKVFYKNNFAATKNVIKYSKKKTHSLGPQAVLDPVVRQNKMDAFQFPGRLQGGTGPEPENRKTRSNSPY